MIDLGPAAQRMATLVAGVSDAQLDASTPCEGASLGALVDHVDTLSVAFAAAAAKDLGPMTSHPPPAFDGSRLAPGWRDRIPDQLSALAVAWRDPTAWDGMTQVGGVDLPGDVVGLAALDELVVHGWDIATASGQGFDVDPEALEASARFVRMISPPEQRTGGSGPFEPAVDVPDDAPLLDRVIALTGRDPGWMPPA